MAGGRRIGIIEEPPASAGCARHRGGHAFSGRDYPLHAGCPAAAGGHVRLGRRASRPLGRHQHGRAGGQRQRLCAALPRTYRKMRRTYSDIPLSIHAGEKDSPGHEVRDTLLLGATRIGHGVNLITDPDTMLLMRNSGYLVEINLISNRLLEYMPDLSKHPFPEYLRFGIPVCLNTDDRGSWDSNMTDEYYTAVTNFQSDLERDSGTGAQQPDVCLRGSPAQRENAARLRGAIWPRSKRSSAEPTGVPPLGRFSHWFRATRQEPGDCMTKTLLLCALFLPGVLAAQSRPIAVKVVVVDHVRARRRYRRHSRRVPVVGGARTPGPDHPARSRLPARADEQRRRARAW